MQAIPAGHTEHSETGRVRRMVSYVATWLRNIADVAEQFADRRPECRRRTPARIHGPWCPARREASNWRRTTWSKDERVVTSAYQEPSSLYTNHSHSPTHSATAPTVTAYVQQHLPDLMHAVLLFICW